MKERGVDALLIGATSDMSYVIGRRLPVTERFNAIVITQTGQPYLIVPHLQLPLVSSLSDEIAILPWKETVDPIRMVANLVERLDLRSIAVDGLMRSGFLLRLQACLGQSVSFSNGSDLTAGIRLFKDADEMSILSDAAKRFDEIWQEFWSNGRLLGVSERNVMEQIRNLLYDSGFETMDWCDVGSGPNGASPLHHHSERIIQAGDPVVIDFAGTINGYFMDTCRTPVAGAPDPEFLDIYAIVQGAHDAANAIAQPGVPAKDVDRAAREVIQKAGYGDKFIHRLGHGLGLDAHEHPYIISDNTSPLQPGMVYSNEPGIYITGKWGVRIEDIIVMTERGARSLNNTTRDIVIMN